MAEGDTPKVSIIVVHWAQNEFRSQKMRECIVSLIQTTGLSFPEILVVDNGGNYEDSQFLLDQTNDGNISCYIRNRKNMSFGFARNQGLKMATGEYICISDNDILYKEGWLEKCIGILEAHPDRKIGVTPLRTDRQHRQAKCWKGELEFNGEKLLLNTKAGSNCWVMRKEDFLEVGRFLQHRVAGSKWADKFVDKGYLMVTMEKNPLAEDLAFKKGYNFRAPIENTEL